MSIHSTAIIDPSAVLGKDVTVGPFSVIGPDARLGDGCRVRSHAVIEHATLGERCEIFPFVSIGLPPQHMKDAGDGTRVEIGAGCVLRESVTVHRGTRLDKSLTVVGANGYFMAYSHIAHDCRLGDNVIMANGAQLAGHVDVGDNSFISTTVGIHQFVRIGRGAIVSGGAMVPLDVAPYCIAQGDRAAIRGLNVIGLRRMGMNRENLKRIKEAYRVVFLAGLSLKDALADPALNVDDENIRIFRDFFSSSKRGFLRPEGLGSADAAEDAV